MESQQAQLLAALGREIRDQRVLEAIGRVPRHLFVPPEYRYLAYEDMPLPIGAGQTISQPFIVALMTQALELAGTETVLEIGTGSGYQAAILAEIAQRVVTIERVPDLADSARARLVELGYANVEVQLASAASLGWPSEAPYDAIVVTAAAPQVPPSLLAQLREGGRMVVPVGSRWEQELLQVRKEPQGVWTRRITYCRFVPLLGPDGWPQAQGSGARSLPGDADRG